MISENNKTPVLHLGKDNENLRAELVDNWDEKAEITTFKFIWIPVNTIIQR